MWSPTQDVQLSNYPRMCMSCQVMHTDPGLLAMQTLGLSRYWKVHANWKAIVLTQVTMCGLNAEAMLRGSAGT